MAFLHEHIILPLSDLIKGEHTYRYMRFLRTFDNKTLEELELYQKNRLQILFRHIAKTVPFYRDWFNEHNISPEAVLLNDLPIVNKSLMRQQGIERFASSSFPTHKRIISRSGGSTGEPFTFYESKLSYSINMASKLNTWYKAGYRLGDRYMKITNSSRSSKLKMLQDKINHCEYLPFYSINDNTLANLLDKIESSKPTIIRSYPVPLYLLAKYRNSHTNYCFQPSHIMTTGSTLPDAYRDEIEKAFGCDIIDSYSCEGTPNTYETTAHDGYNVEYAYGVIEVLDDNNNPITNGIGRVVSTDFWNLAHPFVRYDTQDLVEIKDGRIIRIIGRQCECILSVGGTHITIHNLTKFFANTIPSVSSYRMIRHKNKEVEFIISIENGFQESDKQTIIDYWSNLLQTPITVTIVDHIPLLKNNKHLTIIDEAAN